MGKRLSARAQWTAIVGGLWLAACAPDTPALDAGLTFALPLSVRDQPIELAEVTLTQLGRAQVLAPDDAGMVRARVASHVRLAIDVLVLDVQTDRAPPGLDAFTARAELVPGPGEQTLDLELAAVPAVSGSVLPVFDQGLTLPVAFTGALLVDFTDVATGVSGSIAAQTEVALPAGRLIELAAETPVPPHARQSTIVDATAFGPDTPLPLGVPPRLLDGTGVLFDGRNTLATARIASPDGFAIECTLEPTCSAPFVTALAFPLGFEGVRTVPCRYIDAAGLGCFDVEVAIDDTPPRLAVGFAPSYLPAAGDSSVVVTATANEPVEAATLAVSPYPCDTPVAAGPNGASCSVAIPAAATGPIDLVVALADRFGNRGEANARLLRLDPVATPVGALRLSTYPEEADPDRTFLLAIDVTSFSDACDLTVSTVDLVPPAGPSVATSILGSTTLPALVGSPTAPVQDQLWTHLSLSSNGTPPDGDYSATVTLSYRVCSGTMASAGPFVLPVHLTRPALGWLAADGHLVFSEWTSRFDPGITPPPLWPVLPPDTVYTSSVPQIAAIGSLGGDGWYLAARERGTALVSVSYSGTSEPPATVEVEVAPGPAVALLQSSRVVLRDAAGETSLALGDVGGPLRVLWDSEHDTIVVAGKSAVQIFPRSAAPVLVPLATTGTVADAALAPSGPGRSRGTAVALLIEPPAELPHHVELSLDPSPGIGAVIYDQMLPNLGVCSTPVRLLAAQPLTGDFTAFGNSCVIEYVAATDGIRTQNAASSGGAIEQVEIDPYGGVALTVLRPLAAGPQVVGFSLGALLEAFAPYPFLGSSPDALAIDERLGLPLVATTANGETVVARYGTRLAPSRVLSTEGPLTSDGTALAHLVVDSAHRVLYGVDAASAPRLWAYPLDALPGPPPLSPTAVLAPEPVLDAALVGPEITSVHPAAAGAGGRVTLQGLGFAGGGRDEAFVVGVRAEVVRSTPTSVQIVLPASLGRIAYGRREVWFGVRSQGRLSQARLPFTIVAPPPLRLAMLESVAACDVSGNCNGDATLVAGPLGTFAVWPTTINAVPTGAPLLGAAGSPRAIGSADGLRIAGYDPAGAKPVWLDTRLASAAGPTVEIELQRRAPFDTTATSFGELAVDPTGRLLVLQLDTTDLAWFWSPTYLPAAAPVTMAGLTAFGFSPDGTALVAGASSNGLQLHAFDVSGGLGGDAPPASLPLAIDASCAQPTGTATVVAVLPRPSRGDTLAVVSWNTTHVATARVTAGSPAQATCSPAAGLGRVTRAALSPGGDLLALYEESKRGLLVVDPDAPDRILVQTTLTSAPASLAFDLETPGDGEPRVQIYAPQPGSTTVETLTVRIQP